MCGLFIIGPVYEDDVLPKHPLELLKDGMGKDIELLLGTTAEEFNFWTITSPLRFMPRFAAKWLIKRAVPNPKKV